MRCVVLLLFISVVGSANIQDVINKHSRLNNLDPLLVSALISVESASNPYAKGRDSRGKEFSYGLMQLKPIAAKDVGFNVTTEDLYNPELNIKIGTKYLAKCLFEYASGDLHHALDMYNRGSSRVQKYPYIGNWDDHPYVGKVLRRYRKLKLRGGN